MRLLITFLLLAFGLNAADLIPAIHLPPSGDWRGDNSVGIEGGIPVRGTVFANTRVSIPGTNIVATGDGVTDDHPALQAAVNLCPSNQVVLLPSGRYKLGTRLLLNYTRSITIRGEGPLATIIDGTIGLFGGTSVTDTHTIDTGKERGSTNITISGGIGMPPEALNVGWLLVVRTDGTNTLVNRVGYEGTWPVNPQGQIIEILTLDAAKTNITFKPPIYFTMGNTANVLRQYGSSSYQNFVKYCGLEDFTLFHNNAMESWAIRGEYLDRCWFKNIVVTNSEIAAVSLIGAYRCNIQECDIRESTMDGSGGGYGYLLEGKSTQCLVENNIADRFAASILVDDGSVGNVLAYNYAGRDKYYDAGWNIHSLGHHSSHPMYNLWEGNIANNVFSDFIHGSSSHQLIYRNRLFGWYTTDNTEQNFGTSFHAWNQYVAMLGNVIGWTNRMTEYDLTTPHPFGTEAIHSWGYNGAGAYNANAIDTAYRHMNFDTYTLQTLGTNEGVRVNPATYPTTNLPSSYYLSSKPDWMGNLPFPMIGPDVNTTDFTNIVNPAYLRYLGNTNYLIAGGGGTGGGAGHVAAPVGFRVISGSTIP